MCTEPEEIGLVSVMAKVPLSFQFLVTCSVWRPNSVHVHHLLNSVNFMCILKARVEEDRRGSGLREDSETLPTSSADSLANHSYQNQAYPDSPAPAAGAGVAVNGGLSVDTTAIAYRGATPTPTDSLLPYPSQSTLSSADSASTRGSADSDKPITILDALKIPVRVFTCLASAFSLRLRSR